MVLLVAFGLTLTACSGGGSTSGAASSAVGDAVGGAAGALPAEAGPDSSGAGGPGSLPFSPEILDRQVIVTAELTVRSDDLGRDADRAGQLVDALGGQVSGDVRAGTGDQRTADLVLRVPPEVVEDVLSRLAALGEELSRSVSSQDVTTVVADVDSRVTSLQASLDRLRALTAQATDITDLVTLERELADRETELESVQAQQRALGDQVTLATVSLHLQAAAQPVDEPHGFLSGLGSGWDAFVAAGTTLLIVLGATLPFLAFAAVVTAGLIALRRRRRPVTPAAQSAG